ncbi:glycogen synthase [Consotaella aegiceratis]|uniref:glycogen synthase n=1 Tax=Consotaella aegiceratis TaxID=3097961 RepID=UPI002F3F2CFF
MSIIFRRRFRRLSGSSSECFGTQEIDCAGLRVKGFPGRDLGPLPDERHRRSIDALERCTRILAQQPAGDVVHCHDWYVMPAGLWSKLLYEKPLVITTHSLEPMRGWKREQVGTGGYRLGSWMERVAVEAADAIITVSHSARDDVLRHMDVAAERIHVIHNGVDVSTFRPDADADLMSRYGIDRDRPIVLFVGRLTRQKGLEYLIEAMRLLPDGVQFVVCAGQADTPDYREELKRRYAALTRERRGTFWLDGVSGEALAPLYAAATVFCCPSVYETFAIVNLEAMAAGTPVVAAGVAGNVEQIGDGLTGLLVPLTLDDQHERPSDPGAYVRDLVAALGTLLSDRERARSLGAAGRDHVVRTCSWEAIAGQTAALYDTVLAQSRGKDRT